VLLLLLLIAAAGCSSNGTPAVEVGGEPEPAAQSEATAVLATSTAAPSATNVPTGSEPTASPEPTQTATAVPPTSTPPRPETITHTVQAGETLTSIADRYQVAPQAIIAANDLANPDALQFGQELVIPDALLLPTATPEPRPTAPPALNGVPLTELLVLPPAVVENIREIYTYGQSIGRFPARFSKLGDSTTLNPPLLAKFDTGEYALGPYAYLQSTIEQYAGSFARYGVAARHGLHSWSVFDPFWADKEF